MENKLKEINFHITDVCNGHCPMCYATEEGMCRTNGNIETLKKVVHNAIVNGEVERFVMVGGGPLCTSTTNGTFKIYKRRRKS